ncbi:MAG: L,D-transpeptidase [Bauldia sp.]|nr:L,D-transpeptidase [Bauldia sp.]
MGGPALAQSPDPADIHRAALTQGEFDPFTRVLARIDVSQQRMYVYVENRLVHVWPVSTAGYGSYTPRGQWNAYWLSPNHRSSKYNNAPMPWSVFFNGDYAIHGTTAVGQLGSPASHGCVRLHTDNARIFFDLVERYGMASTVVSVVD